MEKIEWKSKIKSKSMSEILKKLKSEEVLFASRSIYLVQDMEAGRIVVFTVKRHAEEFAEDCRSRLPGYKIEVIVLENCGEIPALFEY